MYVWRRAAAGESTDFTCEDRERRGEGDVNALMGHLQSSQGDKRTVVSEVWSLDARRDASVRAWGLSWPTCTRMIDVSSSLRYEAVALRFNLSPTLTLPRGASRASVGPFDFALVQQVELPSIFTYDFILDLTKVRQREAPFVREKVPARIAYI